MYIEYVFGINVVDLKQAMPDINVGDYVSVSDFESDLYGKIDICAHDGFYLKPCMEIIRDEENCGKKQIIFDSSARWVLKRTCSRIDKISKSILNDLLNSHFYQIKQGFERDEV